MAFKQGAKGRAIVFRWTPTFRSCVVVPAPYLVQANDSLAQLVAPRKTANLKKWGEKENRGPTPRFSAGLRTFVDHCGLRRRQSHVHPV